MSEEAEFLFYHAPEGDDKKIKFMYVVALGKLTTEKSFRKAFPKAIQVSEPEFENLYNLHPWAEVITVGDDEFIDDEVLEGEGPTDEEKQFRKLPQLKIIHKKPLKNGKRNNKR